MSGNSIRVPEKYKSELRNTSSKAYKEAQIRDYVKAHDGEVIKILDLEPIVGTTAALYVRRLVKEGRLFRYSIKTSTNGVSYGYKWVDLKVREEKDRNGPVVVKSLGYKDYPLGGVHTNLLMATAMHDYIESNIDDLPAEQIKGMLLFKRHINQQHAEVEEYNKKLVEGGKDENTDQG